MIGLRLIRRVFVYAHATDMRKSFDTLGGLAREAMGRAGILGFYGAAGLPPARVEAAIVRLRESLGSTPYGFNLIHAPADAALEAACTELFLRHGVRLVSASAYLDLTLHVVRYRVAGIHSAPDGSVIAPNRIVAKVSRGLGSAMPGQEIESLDVKLAERGW